MTSDDERGDRQDIADVLLRYSTGIDRRDWVLFRSCWTADVVADYTEIARWESADAITEFMETAHVDMGHTMHRLSNLAIAIDGNTATARSYVDAILMMPDGKTGLNPTGFYDDDLIRTSEGWRIARRTFTMVLQRTLPT